MAEHANQAERQYGYGGGHHPAPYIPRCKCGWYAPQVTGRPAADASYRVHKATMRLIKALQA